MRYIKSIILLISCLSFISVTAQTKKEKWKGQAPIQKVNTATRPIQYQLKKTFDLGNGIFLSNEFDGARLNGVALTDDNEITVLITPENTPINASPWYAFKMWSVRPKDIQLKITYNDGVGHRYYPKTSSDKVTWTAVDSSVYVVDTAKVPKFCSFNLSVSPDTTWVSAQELIVTKDIYNWSETLIENSPAQLYEIGESIEKRSIKCIELGNSESQEMIMVLSRQHPPEVSGWLGMKAFVERLFKNDTLAKKFIDKYKIFVIPCVNPDGVDNGHWRHGAGGIDLNRDWEAFHQPETQAVRRFMHQQVKDGSKFLFVIDFHSTFQDIYYTISPELKGNMPGLVPKVIAAMGEDIPGYDPNIRPSGIDATRVNSTKSIFHEFGAEAITYEVGDGTPRDLIKKKGELTAENLMKIMLSN